MEVDGRYPAGLGRLLWAGAQPAHIHLTAVQLTSILSWHLQPTRIISINWPSIYFVDFPAGSPALRHVPAAFIYYGWYASLHSLYTMHCLLSYPYAENFLFLFAKQRPFSKLPISKAALPLKSNRARRKNESLGSQKPPQKTGEQSSRGLCRVAFSN
jgi:hypothetical protein